LQQYKQSGKTDPRIEDYLNVQLPNMLNTIAQKLIEYENKIKALEQKVFNP